MLAATRRNAPDERPWFTSRRWLPAPWQALARLMGLLDGPEITIQTNSHQKVSSWRLTA